MYKILRNVSGKSWIRTQSELYETNINTQTRRASYLSWDEEGLKNESTDNEVTHSGSTNVTSSVLQMECQTEETLIIKKRKTKRDSHIGY